MAENNQNAQQKKLTYEQLSQVCSQQQQQIKRLTQQLQEQNYQNVMARLSVLFQVVRSKPFEDSAFQRQCMEEIEEIVGIKKEESQEEEK